MEQQRALNALEPFLALSKSASSARAAADLITQATSAPNTYIFSELLQTPNIQALRSSSEYVSYLRLLEIFAWGSYADYQATPNLPDLNPQQTEKLRLLSLLPLCTSPQTQSYSALQNALSLPTSPVDDLALESLITTAIYSNLLTAHLDPLHRTVRVTSVAPLRDLSPNSINSLLGLLEEWEGRCNDTLKTFEDNIAAIKAEAINRKLMEQQRNQKFEAAIENLDRDAENAAASADTLAEAPGGSAGAKRGSTGGGGGGSTGSTGSTGGAAGAWNRLLGKGGKRAAPMDQSAAGPGPAGADTMDIDESAGGSKGNSRATRRKGSTNTK